ncbi:MAG: TIGR02996 domain-containing protein [Gemmataceae bacterium]
MTDADFLRAVLDQPDDDVCRLAYADWLLERGDEGGAARGEFIQVQVQLARRSEGHPGAWIDSARLPELKAREDELLRAHRTDWAQPIANLVEKYEFRRGFVEVVQLHVETFVPHAQKLFTQAPVRRVRVHGGLHKQFADCPYLERLSGLDFSRTGIGDHGLRVLLASRRLKYITWLDLSHCYVTDRSLAELAASPLLGRLTHLNLSHNYIGQAGVQALFDSPHWGNLRHLTLAGNHALDARTSTFLAQRLQGSHDPALLRTILRTQSREEREYTNAEVRALAQRAGRDPDLAPAILTDALDAGNRKTRASAARMLVQLGAAGGPGLPKLVQRLYDPSVREQVAPALARLLPALHPQMQRWLCLLANPLTSPQANLRDALNNGELPRSVLAEFAAVCARRRFWRDHIANKLPGPAPTPAYGIWAKDQEGVWLAASELLHKAGRHAGRHAEDRNKNQAVAAGSKKEAAWLLARLTELLQEASPAPVPGPTKHASAPLR